MIESLIHFFYFFVSIIIYGVNLVHSLRIKFLEKIINSVIFVFNLVVILFSIYFTANYDFLVGFLIFIVSGIAFLLFWDRIFFDKFKKLFKMDVSFDNQIHRTLLSLSVYLLLNPVILWSFSANLMIITTIVPDFLELLAFQFVIFIFSFVGIGYGTRRNFIQTINRLNIKIPSIKYVIIGLISIVFLDKLIWNFFDVLGMIIQYINPYFGEQISKQVFFESTNVETAVKSVKIVSNTLLKIAFLSIVVGISEELLFRGAIQPRFGNVYTSILFSVLHAHYFSIIVFLGIFLISYVLGKIKEKSSTSTPILIHILYDFFSLLF
ncbi:Abortive infection protein [Methanococcus vannielii SB]|uniref:Abortive infection protein n=1 Tax=Methanococcus vannielii (strain ATCC 35089 / DSM 1224 / JCM 13029 / OCM 148 / SB) TaxID=406327 RepID=A6UR66_METVS|nr:CPBP family intramembrane glutamic endopeptidase [Methanococcus vannielii]ABR54988.1 Abortive infection protein [Methanococcus vannielii SB]